MALTSAAYFGVTLQQGGAAAAAGHQIAPEGAADGGYAPGHIHFDFNFFLIGGLIPGRFLIRSRQEVEVARPIGQQSAAGSLLLSGRFLFYIGVSGQGAEYFALLEVHQQPVRPGSRNAAVLYVGGSPGLFHFQGGLFLQQYAGAVGVTQPGFSPGGEYYGISGFYGRAFFNGPVVYFHRAGLDFQAALQGDLHQVRIGGQQ